MAGQAAAVVKDGTEKQGALAAYSHEQIEHLRNFIAPGFTNDELAFFLAVAKQKGLDPFTRQVHAVKRKLRGQDESGKWVDGAITRVDVMTGIDGYRAIAARSGDYAPGDETVQMDSQGYMPLSATVSVRKLVHGQWLTFSATAYFDEYAAKYKDQKTGEWKLGEMWRKMPRRMITKCAEALALRKGWPEQLSDIYASEEMDRATSEEQPAGAFAALQQEAAPAIPAPQVVAAPPPAAKPVQQPAPAPQQAAVLDMQAARVEQQRPEARKGEALPEVWAVTDAIPDSVVLWLKPLLALAGKPVHGMTVGELELVIETCKRGYAAAKASPKSTQQLLKLLMTITASAQASRDQKLGKQAAAETPLPEFTDSMMPAGA